MKSTDNRKADVATFRTDTEHKVVKAWVSHDAERKAYVMTIVPVEVKVYSDGAVIHKTAAYSGYRLKLADAPRYSRRTLDKLAADALVQAREIAETNLGAVL